MYLSLVVPVYNFEKHLEDNIEKVITALKGQVPSYEIILVNDGSSDGSLQRMKNLAKVHGDSSQHFNITRGNGKKPCTIKIVNIQKNMGKGYAVKRGVEEASGEYIFFTDVDLPYGMEPVIDGCNILEKGSADIAIGSRDIPDSKAVVPYGIVRRVSKKIFSVLSRKVTKLNITDSQCGIKGFTRDAAKNIFSRITRNRFSFDVEILCIARMYGYKIHLMPVNLTHSPTSTVRLLKDSFCMVWGLISIASNEQAGRYGAKGRGEGI